MLSTPAASSRTRTRISIPGGAKYAVGLLLYKTEEHRLMTTPLAMLNFDAAVLHHLQTCRLGTRCRLRVRNAQLHPHRACAYCNSLVYHGGHVVAAAKNHHDVDALASWQCLRSISQRRITTLAQYLRLTGRCHHRVDQQDAVASGLQVARYIKAVAVRLWAAAHNGNRAGLA